MVMRVFDRLSKVLVLIIEVKIDDDLVKTKRGNNFNKLDLLIDLTRDTEEPPELIKEGERKGKDEDII